MGDAGRAAAWLPLVVGLEGAARVRPRDRPAHFRRQRPAWEAAADVFGEVRYARLGDRLARWRTPDPRLAVVKELLWALEQPEAAGYTRLALAGTQALVRLVPADDVRVGYVLAQSARAVRTLGDLEGAIERYVVSEKLGHRHHDRWLRARSNLGLGTTYQHIGNYPAARVSFQRTLEKSPPDNRIAAAAHHGLLVNAMVAQDWDTALDKGWYLLQARRSGAIPRAEVLNLLAELCRRIGRYRAAVRAAEAALREPFRPDRALVSLAVLVQVAAMLRDRRLGQHYGPLLRECIGTTAGPFEDARALVVLARLEQMCGATVTARADLGRARAIADRFGYHELQFETEKLEAVLNMPPQRVNDRDAEIPGMVPLSAPSQYIVSQLDSWNDGSVSDLAGMPG